MPRRSPAKTDTPGPPHAETHRESLYDEYVDALLRGDVEDPDAFLARHGHSDDGLRDRLNVIHEEVKGRAHPPDPPGEPGSGGRHLGEFRLLNILGEGGMGVVHLARQESLDRLVALKVIRPELARSTTAMARFEREARAIARLRHPNIVTVYAVGEDKGVRYIAMELASGNGLNTVIATAADDGESVPIATVLRWTAELARALDYAHEHGIVHRDVKPSNIRITPEGRPLLLDFGLARELDSAGATLTEAFVGSPHYVAPEQIARKGGVVDGRTDVYSLGVVLYQCLTGRLPFGEGSLERILRGILVDDPPLLRSLRKSLPREAEIVTLKAIEKDPDRRYRTAAAFADDLEALLEYRPIRARPPGPVARTMKWAKRNPAAAAGAGAVLVAVIALAGILSGQAYLRAEANRADARNAMALAGDKLVEYQRLRETSAQVEADVVRLRNQMQRQYLQSDEIELLDRHEAAMQDSRLQREELFYEIQQELQRARRLDPDIRGAQDVLANLYMEKWRESDSAPRAATLVDPVDLADAKTAESFYRNLVEESDAKGRHVAELSDEVTVKFETHPPGAEVYVFRYREQAELFEGGDPRLVPVPISLGPEPQLPVRPGTWCLRVVRATGDLAVNDLIVEIAGFPIEGTVLVEKGNDLVKHLDRLVEVDGVRIRDAYEVRHPAPARGSDSDAGGIERTFVFERSGRRYEVMGSSLDSLGIRAVDPKAIAEEGLVPAKIYRSGTVRNVTLPEGLRVRVTAAPLLDSPASRFGLTPFVAPMDTKRFLCLFRLEGFEDCRLSINLTGDSDPDWNEVFLLPSGSTPDGFVAIATTGGTTSGFFYLMEREVTCREYLEFLNDPETLRQVDESDIPIRYPRTRDNAAGGGDWPRDEDGGFRLPSDSQASWPILGVSWADATAYATWRTVRAQAQGLQWRFSLPTRIQWEAAGQSEGFYLFGNRFRPRWVSSCFARPSPSPEPVFSYPIDESVYGIFDMSGSAAEWLDDWFWEQERKRPLMGGSWATADMDHFRINHWIGAEEDGVSSTFGFRLVLSTAETETFRRQQDRHMSLWDSISYLSGDDSVFDWNKPIHVEDFEDGVLNTPGVTASAGAPKGPGPETDSVDADDGVIDGTGTAGWSFASADGSAGITFTFDETVLGGLPRGAGIVWTDGSGVIAFEAFDHLGVSMGERMHARARRSRDGATAGDRMFAVGCWRGISAIKISNTTGNIEVDHLQYGDICTTTDIAVELVASTCPDCLGPLPYFCQEDSPFDLSGLGTTFFLEDFEDGELNSPGVEASDGVLSPETGMTGDSVDCDDGVIDGIGRSGWALFGNSNDAGVTFSFTETSLGGLPTEAGIVWTESGDLITFEAFDPTGESLGTISAGSSGEGCEGMTSEDRFFGVRHAEGISAIRISCAAGGFEVDHLQYGRVRPLAPPPEAEPADEAGE